MPMPLDAMFAQVFGTVVERMIWTEQCFPLAVRIDLAVAGVGVEEGKIEKKVNDEDGDNKRC